MFQQSALAQVLGAILIAVMFAVAPHPGQAQSAAPSAKPAAKPAARPAPAAVTSSVNGAEQSDYWSVNAALPSQYATGRSQPQAKPAAERGRATAGPGDNTRPLSRVPLRDAPGSVGFTAGQSTRSGRFEDGREVPGLIPNTQQESSYVGVSLSVTSAGKGLPLPFGRPE